MTKRYICLFAPVILAVSLSFTALSYGENVADTSVEASDKFIELTLEEAVAAALRDNRDVKLSREGLSAAKARTQGARSFLFPSFSATGSYQFVRDLYFKDIYRFSTGVSVKQYLYRGGKTLGGIDQAVEGEKMSQAAIDVTNAEILRRVVQAYYTYMLAIGYSELNRKILSNSENHYSYADALYRTGHASELDLAWAKRSLENVRSAFAESKANERSALEMLRNILYLEEDVFVVTAGSFRYSPVDIELDEKIMSAIRNRPEIRQNEAEARQGKEAVEIARQDSRPSIYASWDYYSSSHETYTTAKNWNDYNVVGMTVSWPVFDGWAANARLKEAISSLSRTDIARERLIKDIALEVTKAYSDIKEAEARTAAREADVSYYDKQLENVKEKYSKGLVSDLGLEDAVIARDVAVFSRDQAVYLCIAAASDLKRAAGETENGIK